MHNTIDKLYANARLDAEFNRGGCGPAGWIFVTRLLPDGRILLGGIISSYNGMAVPGGIIRLHPDGSLDRTFNPGGTGARGSVSAIEIDPQGRILIAGWFDEYNGIKVGKSITRLRSDGTLDRTFNPHGSGADKLVRDMAIMPDGRIIICGDFVQYNDSPVSRHVARLFEDGTADHSFNPGGGADKSVFSVKMQHGGKVLISGLFTNFNDVDVFGHIVRLFNNGFIDNCFNFGQRGANTPVTNITMLDGIDALVSGGFTSYNNDARCASIVRITADGQVVNGFNAGKVPLDGFAHVAAMRDPAGNHVIGLVSYDRPETILMINGWGAPIAAVQPQFKGTETIVSSMCLPGGSRLLLGGHFSCCEGEVVSNNLACLRISR